MIYDIDDVPLSNGVLNLAGDTQTPFTIRLQCHAGRFLRAEAVANMAVEARVPGDPDWEDLESTGIDMTPYDGTTQDFEVRITTDDVTDDVSEILKIYQE